jgi:hypothetical protein
MNLFIRSTLAIFASVMLFACDAPAASELAVSPPDKNASIHSSQDVPRSELRSADERKAPIPEEASVPVPKTTTIAGPKPPNQPGPARLNPATPKREIQPSPFQPPAEVDPAHVPPGDGVPR